jgi:hypothetical protein
MRFGPRVHYRSIGTGASMDQAKKTRPQVDGGLDQLRIAPPKGTASIGPQSDDALHAETGRWFDVDAGELLGPDDL